MRTVVFALVVAVCCGAVLAAEKNSGLVLHYTFDKGAVQDQSGFGNDGKVLGGAKLVTGEFGSAMEFNGTDAYIDCGAKPTLNIGRSGTIAFWFKPRASRQGGLVGWAAAEGKPNQRLVVSLNSGMEEDIKGNHFRQALGLYISDGTNFDRPYRSSYHKPYFPPADRWLFYTVTFDGRAVEIYRDGVHVISRFQTLVPDTTNVPMLLGKCFGVGGASDYFKGLMDEVRIYNRPLSSPEIYRVYMKDAAGRDKPTTSFGSVGIKLSAYPKPGIIFADLDYRGVSLPASKVNLSAALLDVKGAEVAQARIRMLPAWGRAEAVVDAAQLLPGHYSLRVTATKASPQVAEIEWSGREPGWEKVKVLNNFCWELLNETPRAKPKSAYTFNNPRRGWVYFMTETKGDLTLTVPGANPEIIHAPHKFAQPAGTEDYPVMRWLDKGPQTVTVSGNGTLKSLVVRAVPILYFWHYPHVGPGAANDHDFLVKHVLGPCNAIDTHDYGEDYNPNQFRQKWASQLGRHVFDHNYAAGDFGIWYAGLKDDTARQQIWDYMTSGAGLLTKSAYKGAGLNKPEYKGVSIDEFTAGNEKILWNKSYLDEWAETCAKILEDPKYAGRFVMPAMGYNMYDYGKSTAFLRMFIAHGSPVIEQWYLEERDSEEQAWLWINECGAELEPKWNAAIPGYTENAIKLLHNAQRNMCNPAVDFKVHLEMQFEHFATRPEFFGLAGIGIYPSYRCPSEEYVRWGAELSRHYGLEGNTERLGTTPYESAQIRNPDFINGADGWTLKPAAPGSMAIKSHPGYGAMQARYPYRTWTETPFLWTKRSAGKPNIFSQEIRNLKPGKLYSVRLWTGDYAALMAGKFNELPDKPCTVNISVEGGEVWDDWYRTKAYTDTGGAKSTFFRYGAPATGCQAQQLIFRATGPTATLNISDWESDTKPGGHVGQELMFNKIDVHPYLEP